MTIQPWKCPHQTHPELFDQVDPAAPISKVTAPGGVPVWLVTDYAEGKRTLNDPRLLKDPLSFSELPGGLGRKRCPEDFTLISGRHVMNTDGEHHTRLRAVIAPLMSPKALERWRPEIEAAVRARVDAIADSERFDLVMDFAVPLAAAVLSHVLGVDSAAVVRALLAGKILLDAEHPESPAMKQASVEFAELTEHFVRTGKPGGVVSGVLADGSLTRREASSLIGTVVAGASSPLMTLLATAAAVVLVRPDLREAVAAGQVSEVVEEIARLQPPALSSSWRFTAEPMEIGGVRLDRGEAVRVLFAAANQDPAAEDGRHLSFGHGRHFCVGATLARHLTAEALRVLVERCPELELLTPIDEISWHGGLGDRCPDRMEAGR